MPKCYVQTHYYSLISIILNQIGTSTFIARPLSLHFNHYVSLALSLDMYYNLLRPLGLYYNHLVNPSVRPWSVSEYAHQASCIFLPVD